MMPMRDPTWDYPTRTGVRLASNFVRSNQFRDSSECENFGQPKPMFLLTSFDDRSKYVSDVG